MKVLSIDIIRKEFTNLVVTEIIPSNKNTIILNYETNDSPCITRIPGMVLSQDGFDSFMEGNIVELHKGEIAIVKIEEE